MSKFCEDKVIAWAKENGHDSIPSSRIRAMAQEIEAFREKNPDANALQIQAYANAVAENYALKEVKKVQAAEKLAARKLGEAVVTIKGATHLEPRKAFSHYISGGSEKWMRGGNIDPGHVRNSIAEKAFSILYNELPESDMSILRTNVGARDFFQELDAIHNKLGAQTMNPVAQRLAKAFHRVDTYLFGRGKSVNPHLEFSTDRLVHRTYNRDSIAAMGEENFVALMTKETEVPGLYGEDLDKVIRGTYKRIISGRSGGRTLFSDIPFGDKKLRKMSAGRVFLAKGWESEHKLYEAFGSSSLGEMLNNMIFSRARDVGLMTKYTHDFPKFARDLVNEVFDTPEDRSFGYKYIRDVINGFNPIQATTTKGKLVRALTAFEAGTHLWTAPISSLSDLPVAAQRLSALQGSDIFSATAKVVSDYTFGVSPAAKKAIAASIEVQGKIASGIMQETMGLNPKSASWEELGNLAKEKKFADLAYKGMSKYAQLTMKWSGMDSFHIPRQRFGMETGLVEALGKMSDFGYDKIELRAKNELSRYSFDKEEWEFMRKGVQDIEGQKFLTVDMIDDISDADTIAYMRQKGWLKEKDLLPTKEELAGVRAEISTRLGAMTQDYIAAGTSTRGTWETNLIIGDSDINTWWGAMRAFATQFKSAAVVNMRNAMRSMYSGENPFRADISQLAGYAATALIFGGIVVTAKDIARGKTPPNPLSIDFALRAFVASGMLSFYADLIDTAISEENPTIAQGKLVSLIGGPVTTDAIDVALTLGGYARAGIGAAQEASEGALGDSFIDAKAPYNQTVKMIQNQVPNVPFFKEAVDYFFLNGIREMANSGYLNRRQKTVEKTPGLLEDSQRYFMFNPRESKRWE